MPRGRSHPRRFQLRTPDAPRGDGISSRSASPRQGVPHAGHCAATAATTTAATINTTSARDSLASPWSPTPGPSHSQNRPSGRGLDHVPRDPSPGGNPESPDPAGRPLTPRAPPLPERPRVGPRPRSATPRPHQPRLPLRGPVRPSPGRAHPHPRAQPAPREGNDHRRGEARAAGARLLTGSALPAAGDRGPAAMPRLHPGRRAGSGVPGPRGHRRAGGEEIAGPGSGGGGDRVSSDHASGWDRGGAAVLGGSALALASLPPSLSLFLSPLSSPFLSPSRRLLWLARLERRDSRSTRRRRRPWRSAQRAAREGARAAARPGRAAGRGGPRQGQRRPDAPLWPEAPARSRACTREVGEARRTPKPGAAQFPSSAALRSRTRFPSLPPSLTPCSDPEAGQPLPRPLPSCHPGPGQERTTLGIPRNGTRAPRMGLGHRGRMLPNLCHRSAPPGLLFQFAHTPTPYWGLKFPALRSWESKSE